MTPVPEIIHEIVPVGPLQCNCHVVGDLRTHDAIVIDPGGDAERILGILQRYELKVSAIVITHTHIDHVAGLHRIREATGAPVYMHADDLGLYQMLDQQAAWIGWRTPETVRVDQLLKDGDIVRWAGYPLHVLHTAGHTPGSICLYMPVDVTEAQSGPKHPEVKRAERGPGKLFAGDTLFAGSIGRTDLWGGSFEEIIRSLKGKVLQLPDETIVYPGHGESTTIGEERDSNPFLIGN